MSGRNYRTMDTEALRRLAQARLEMLDPIPWSELDWIYGGHDAAIAGVHAARADLTEIRRELRRREVRFLAAWQEQRAHVEPDPGMRLEWAAAAVRTGLWLERLEAAQ